MMYGSPANVDTVRFEHQHAEDGVAAAAQTCHRGEMSEGLLVTVSADIYCFL